MAGREAGMQEITQDLVYDYNVDTKQGSWWGRAHRAGCKDARELPYPIPTTVYSFRELIEEMASDFIFANDERPWTDYERDISLAPCVKLPREVGDDA